MNQTPSSRSGAVERPVKAGLGVAALCLGLAFAGGAQATDVYWSVGIHQPGVSVGVSNAPPAPVVVYPAPRVIYSPPQVVYSTPRVVYGPAPVVIYPQPVYRAGWAPPGHRKHWHKHGRHHGSQPDRWRGDREGRWEGHGRDGWYDDRRDDRR